MSTVKVSTANANCPHQRWTSQLLRGNVLLPHSSTLKLVSLLVGSGASRRLVLGDDSCLTPPPTENEVMLHQYWKGGRNCGRNCRILRISPLPLCFVLRPRLPRGGGAYLLDTTVHTLQNSGPPTNPPLLDKKGQFSAPPPPTKPPLLNRNKM